MRTLHKIDKVLINGKLSRITHNESKSEEWSIEDANPETLKILDELLKYKDSDFMFPSGITVINPLSTTDIVKATDSSRPSNSIGIIRSELPCDTIITFRIKNERDKYGLIKSDKNIRLVENSRQRIINVIEARDLRASKHSEKNRSR